MTVSTYQVDEHIKSDYITGFKEFASSNDFIFSFEMNTLLLVKFRETNNICLEYNTLRIMKINSSDSESDSDLFDEKNEDIIDEENYPPHKPTMNIEWKKHLRLKEILIDKEQKESRITNLYLLLDHKAKHISVVCVIYSRILILFITIQFWR